MPPGPGALRLAPMEISVHTPGIEASDPDLAEQVRDILGRFSERLTRIEALIKDMNAEIDRLRADLAATREKNGIYMSQ